MTVTYAAIKNRRYFFLGYWTEYMTNTERRGSVHKNKSVSSLLTVLLGRVYTGDQTEKSDISPDKKQKT